MIRRPRAVAAMAAAAVSLATAGVAAQSTSYPPAPPDHDRDGEQRSKLWEAALDPGLGPYHELVRTARQHIERGTPEDTSRALELLADAIARRPDQPAAYLVRGKLHLARRMWRECADDLAMAEGRAAVLDDPAGLPPLLIDLGACQARAGRHVDAERSLVRAAAIAPQHRAEAWMRLGEVRIALGKLDEAIDALTAALDHADVTHQLTRWLLLVAYDRARRPADAQEQAEMARDLDPRQVSIDSPTLPLLGAGDALYLHAVAYRYATPKPEHALAYFRGFLAQAPASPWRRRAEEHVRELSAMRLPARETIAQTGPAAVDLTAVRDVLVRQMPPLRRCVATLSSTVFQVSVTRVGPRTPASRDRPVYRMPAASARAERLLEVGDPPPGAAQAAALRCLEAELARLTLPPPKERDTWFTLTFSVVGP